ncbi:MAG: hypothetical protein PHE70_08480 [Tepidanaerobacteraceae bacterium]|nr:hypothetical protein [Tepidanaerobacteraceae bacterium]
MVIALILVFILILLLEVPGLLKKKAWKELAAFSVLLTIGFVLGLLQVIGVKIPSPNDGIMLLLKLMLKIDYL